MNNVPFQVRQLVILASCFLGASSQTGKWRRRHRNRSHRHCDYSSSNGGSGTSGRRSGYFSSGDGSGNSGRRSGYCSSGDGGGNSGRKWLL